MRIIGGKFKGRRFTSPAKGWPTRPTTDYAKEGLFNVLTNRIDFEQTKVLDLFGGSGNISYELISRGCKDVTYVDKFPACVQFVKATAAKLQVENQIRIFRRDVFRFISKIDEQFDLIFADAPYDLDKLATIPDLIFEQNRLAENGLLIVEHDSKNNFAEHPRFKETRKYSSTIFSFFE